MKTNLKIAKFSKWRTSDGVEHSTYQMAEHWILLAAIKEAMAASGISDDAITDAINFIESNRKIIRNLLDACDAMEKAAQL